MTNELTQKQITSPVAARIGEMQNEGLMIAQNYSVSNALSSAYYALKNSSSGNLLQMCTQDSIYNALLDMVTQGLSPAKTQCYIEKQSKKQQTIKKDNEAIALAESILKLPGKGG